MLADDDRHRTSYMYFQRKMSCLLVVCCEGEGITFSSIPETWNWRPESSITEHGIRIDYLSEIHGVNARAENESINRSR